MPLNSAWGPLALGLSGRTPRRFPHAGPGPALSESHPNRWAAVSVILAPDPDSVLLIRRAERSGDPWSGHIGLPGGRAERGDPDLAATAMRETAEEIGWPLSRDALLGELDDVWPHTPLPQIIVVRPFVFAVKERPAVSPSAEVAEAFWVPLNDLRNPAILRDTQLQVRGQRLTFPAYHLPQGVVWGLTERILTPLLSLTSGDRPEPRTD